MGENKNRRKSFFAYNRFTGLLEICKHFRGDSVETERVAKEQGAKFGTQAGEVENFQYDVLRMDGELYLMVLMTFGEPQGLIDELMAKGWHDLSAKGDNVLAGAFSLALGPTGIRAFEMTARQWAHNCSIGYRV